jgi:hypothetical protein
MNFNDFLMGMVTLFHIMIVNNWFVTCNMLCIIKDNSYPIIFFVAFWILTVLIMLNLVISFILEIYSDTESKVEKTYTRNEWIKKLKDQFDDIKLVYEESEDESSSSSEEDRSTPRMGMQLSDLLDGDSFLEVKEKKQYFKKRYNRNSVQI